MLKDEPKNRDIDAEFKTVFFKELKEVQTRRKKNNSEGFLGVKSFLEYCRVLTKIYTHPSESEEEGIKSATPLEAIQKVCDAIEQERAKTKELKNKENLPPSPPEIKSHLSQPKNQENSGEKKGSGFGFLNRAKKFTQRPKEQGDAPELPSISHELIGLSFSGGGIRSAAFHLGVLQALHKCKLTSHIDYLSTVSGGGYIGSCISSLYAPKISYLIQFRNWINKQIGKSLPSAEADTRSETKFPFEHQKGTPEPATFRHLRNNSNYLASKGIIDFLTIPALILRGMILNFLILLPYVLAAVLFTAIFHPTPGDLNINTFADKILLPYFPYSKILGENFPFTKLLILFTLFIFSFFPLLLGVVEYFNYFGLPEWEARDNSRRLFAGLLGLMPSLSLRKQ